MYAAATLVGIGVVVAESTISSVPLAGRVASPASLMRVAVVRSDENAAEPGRRHPCARYDSGIRCGAPRSYSNTCPSHAMRPFMSSHSGESLNTFLFALVTSAPNIPSLLTRVGNPADQLK